MFVAAVTREAMISPMPTWYRDPPPAIVYPRMKLIEGKTHVLGLDRRKTMERLWGMMGTEPKVGSCGVRGASYGFLVFRFATLSTVS